MNDKHTPGPWKAVRSGAQWEIWAGADAVVALVPCEEGTPDLIEADAHLVAAAPELLEALRFWERWYSEDCVDDAGPARHLGLAVIAKAEGREP